MTQGNPQDLGAKQKVWIKQEAHEARAGLGRCETEVV